MFDPLDRYQIGGLVVLEDGVRREASLDNLVPEESELPDLAREPSRLPRNHRFNGFGKKPGKKPRWA